MQEKNLNKIKKVFIFLILGILILNLVVSYNITGSEDDQAILKKSCIGVNKITGEKIKECGVSLTEKEIKKEREWLLKNKPLRSPKNIFLPSGRAVSVKGGVIEIETEEEENEVYYIMQLYSPLYGLLSNLDDDTRNDILSLVKVLDSRDDYAFFVKIPESSFPELRGLIIQGKIRYIGPILPEMKTGSRLSEELKTKPESFFNISLSSYEEFSEEEKEIVNNHFSSVLFDKDTANGVISGNNALEILKFNFVKSISETSSLRILNLEGTMLSGSDFIWSSPGGYTGSGIKIGIIDTGIAQKNGVFHPDLPASRIIDQEDHTALGTNPAIDLCGHGTHVAGIVGGSGEASDYYGGVEDKRWKGVAPEAELVIHKVISDSLLDFPVYVSYAFGRAAQNRANIMTSSIDISPFADSGEYGDGAKYIDRAVRGYYKDNDGKPVYMFVAQAAGNDYCKPVISFGTNKNGLTVGAVIDGYPSQGETPYDWPPGGIAPYSSCGPVDTDKDGKNRTKPDVVAPGGGDSGSITSPVPWYENDCKPCPGEEGNLCYSGYYLGSSGTSMATPFVAGTAALFLQAYPEFKNWPEVVKAHMINTAIPLGDKNKFGYGLIDAYHMIYDDNSFKTLRLYGFSLDNSDRSKSIYFNIPYGFKEVRVTVTWPDPPGSKEVYNDVDLKVYDSNGVEVGKSLQFDETVERVVATSGAEGQWHADVSLYSSSGELPQTVGLSASVVMDNPALSLKASSDKQYVIGNEIFTITTELSNNGYTATGSYISINYDKDGDKYMDYFWPNPSVYREGDKFYSYSLGNIKQDPPSIPLGDIVQGKIRTAKWTLETQTSKPPPDGDYTFTVKGNAKNADEVTTYVTIHYCRDGDKDRDGYISKECGGNDCNDNNGAINPGIAEVCNDGIDNDCDGLIDTNDAADCGTQPGECSSNADCGYWTGWRYCRRDGNVGDFYCSVECINPGSPQSRCSSNAECKEAIYEYCKYGCRDGRCRNSSDIITVCKDGSCNFTNIKAALDYSLPGDTVFVTDKGIYTETVVWPNNNITLDCNGAVLTGFGLSIQKYLWCFGGGNITDLFGIYMCGKKYNVIQNCEIRGYSTSYTDSEGFTYTIGSGIGIYGSNYNLFINNKIHSNKDGIYTYSSKENKIIDNNISFNWNGLQILYSYSNFLIDNVISSNANHGIYFYYAKPLTPDKENKNTAAGNIISSNYIGAKLYNSVLYNFTKNIFCPSSGNVDLLITNSSISNGSDNTCDKPGEWNDEGAAGCTYSCPKQGEVTVCKDGSCSYTTIQEAVNFAIPGSTIRVTDQAVYREQITLGKYNITLNCQGAVLDGKGLPPKQYPSCSRFIQGSFGIYLSDNRDVTIKNCTIRNYEGDMEREIIGLGIAVSNFSDGLFINNTISSSMGGISISCHSKTAQIQNNIITNNTLIVEQSFGIFIEDSSQIVVKDNIISSNEIGIGFENTSANIINDNHLCPPNNHKDFYWQFGSQGSNQGYNNTCNKPGSWNDEGATGCTYRCPSPPIINFYSPVINPIIKENESQEFSINASDPENDPITFKWYLDGNTTEILTPHYTYVADYNSAGIHNITVFISDDTTTVSKEWILRVINVNRRPTIPSLVVLNSTTVYINAIFTCNTSGSMDPDGDAIIYYYEFRNGFAILQRYSINDTYACSGSVCNKNDNITCYAKTHDKANFSEENKSNSVIIQNAPPNIPTTVNLTPMVAYKGTTFTCIASGSSDSDNDTLTYYYTFYKPGTILGDSTNSTYICGQNCNKEDVIYCDAKAFDGSNYSGNETSNGVIILNSPPILNAIGNKTVKEGGLLEFVISAADVDEDYLIYSVSYLPSGANFSGNRFSWKPTYEQAGTYYVTFNATDGELRDSETAKIIVNDIEIIVINSLVNNQWYNRRKFLLNLTLAEKVKGLYYGINGRNPEKLCSNCNSYSKKISFVEGQNNLTIEVVTYDGNSYYSSISLFTDSIKPKIYATMPSKVGNGTFSIQYTEVNLKNIVLFYGSTFFNLENSKEFKNCSSGNKVWCSDFVDLRKYNGKYIYYRFLVKDRFYSSYSNLVKIKISAG